MHGGGAVTGVNEGIRALDRKSALAVGQRDARFDLNVSGSVIMWAVVVVNGSFDAGFCVVFGGVANLDVSEGVRALDGKSACVVGRNYAKFEFTVVNDVQNKQSSCRLGAGWTHLDDWCR